MMPHSPIPSGPRGSLHLTLTKTPIPSLPTTLLHSSALNAPWSGCFIQGVMFHGRLCFAEHVPRVDCFRANDRAQLGTLGGQPWSQHRRWNETFAGVTYLHLDHTFPTLHPAWHVRVACTISCFLQLSLLKQGRYMSLPEGKNFKPSQRGASV